MAPADPHDRLRRRDWTDLGLEVLEAEGFTAITAQSLAKRLGVSRGSFYWHFRDIGEFEAALIARWRDIIFAALGGMLADIASPIERLETLMRRTLASRRRLELAFRAWGTANQEVAASLAEIDTRRADIMARLLTEAGVPARRARSLAQLAYWTYLGQAMTAGHPREDTDAVVDELMKRVTG
jgi:AcrR family transcriptional regulator